MIHLGFLNSYNLLTGNTSIEDIVKSGAGIFSYPPDEDAPLEAIELMIFYFKEMEMYDKCAVLQKYIEKNYNKEGKFIEKKCECDYPEIDEYIPKVKCSICNLRLKI